MNLSRRLYIPVVLLILGGWAPILAPVQAAAPSVEVQALDRKEALASSSSAQLKTLVGGWFSGWRHGQKGQLIGHARNEEALKAVLHEAYYYGLVLQRLLGQAQQEPIHIVVVQRPKTWITRLQAFMPHGGVQSFYADGTIFLYRPEGQQQHDLSDLPHELVHAWVDAGGRDWPLWLEEGLALSWGETLAQKYYTLQNRYVKAAEVSQPQEGLDPTSFMAYPNDPEKALRFYRSSKVLVRAIERLLDDAEFRTFLSEMTKPQATWQRVLKEQWGVDDKKIESMTRLLKDLPVANGPVPYGKK